MRAFTRWFRILVPGMIAGVMMLMSGSTALGAWRIEVESKTVFTNAPTGVTVGITYAWDIGLAQTTLPLVVRSIDAGSFWAGSLPYDTMDGEGNPYTNGVAWHASVSAWAGIIKEMRTSAILPGDPCAGNNATQYDGVSPDNFVMNAQGVSNLAAKPSGIVFVTLTIDVTTDPGQFEFDTACFLGASMNKIFMLDATSTDHGPPPGTGEVDFNKGIITIVSSGILSEQGDVPAQYSLGQNFPNPFNANTVIEFSLRETGPVKVEVFNILGQRVATPVDDMLPSGAHSADWDGRDYSGRAVASGMYFYRLTAGEFSQMKKMVLMK